MTTRAIYRDPSRRDKIEAGGGRSRKRHQEEAFPGLLGAGENVQANLATAGCIVVVLKVIHLIPTCRDT